MPSRTRSGRPTWTPGKFRDYELYKLQENLPPAAIFISEQVEEGRSYIPGENQLARASEWADIEQANQ